jgi:predicted phosphodiesterase
MKIIEHHIKYKYGDTITIKPIADVHMGNALCDIAAFKKYISSDPDALYVGLGDLLDSIVCTDKRYSKQMDSTEGEGIIDEQINAMYDILKPISKRIIGLGEGNHERTICKSGTNPIKRLCEMLSVPCLGYAWICRLNMREEEGRGRSVLIYGHHGWGGGSRTQGADLTKYSRALTNYQCDIFLFGHTHRLVVDRVEQLGLVGTKLISKPKHIAVCGTFLKTVSPDEIPSWAETKGFAPARIGAPLISIKPTRDWVDIGITT